jgi:hypothetical protein
MVSLPIRLATFFDLIQIVVPFRPKEEMTGIGTGSDVAMVEDAQPRGYRPVMDLVADPMGEQHGA